MKKVLGKMYFKYILRPYCSVKFALGSILFYLYVKYFCLCVANTSPIFTLTPNVSWGSALVTTANTAYDGSGTVVTVFTAGSNGSFVNRVRFKLGSTAGTSAASVARVFINNGSTNATAANNILWEEITLPAIAQTQVAATPPLDIILNIALPASYKLNITIGTSTGGSTGWYVSALGGDY